MGRRRRAMEVRLTQEALNEDAAGAWWWSSRCVFIEPPKEDIEKPKHH
jgi:hypothetical protein